MSATQIQSLNEFHEQLARWTLENPHLTLRHAAQRFGYSVTWLSIIMNSDAFRARLAELNAAADALVVADVPQRLRGLAVSALDKLDAQLEEVIVEGPMARVDRDFTRETAEMALKALGYGAKHTSAPQPSGAAPSGTVIYADKVLVQEARARILARGEPRTIDAQPEGLRALEGPVPQDAEQASEVSTGA